jgi:hypothetical protein
MSRFAALFDARAQEERTQVLLDRTRTDVELPSDFFVTASLAQQAKHIFIPRGNLDHAKVNHVLSSFSLGRLGFSIPHVRRFGICTGAAKGGGKLEVAS